jgi:hypothetical protein
MIREVVLLAVFVATGVAALAVPVLRERLSSMKTGIALLALVSAFAVAGVLIGQDLPADAYVERFGAAWAGLITGSGLASVFRSWFFLLSVWVLTLSILSCSFRRIARLVRGRGPKLTSIGSLVIHLSLVVVLVGGVLMATIGFRRADSRFLRAGETTEVPEGGFALRVDEARTEFASSGMISEYVSVVTVLEDGREVETRRIEVNHPLTVNGVGIYQYEMLPSPDSVNAVLLGVVLNDPDRAVEPFELEVPYREGTPIPGTNLTVKALEFYSDFTYDIDTGTAGLASIWHDNPAVLVQVSASGEVVFERWLFPGTRGHDDDADLPCRLFFLDYDPDFENGLTRFEYSRQPGTPVLFAGLAALSLGLCAVFWTRIAGRDVK